jgi:hypothetical protein
MPAEPDRIHPMRFPFPAPAALCGLLAATTLSASAADTSPAAITIIDADEIVFDRSQVEWAESYLQWIAAFARGSSPSSDTTGAQCGAKQGGEVWFLASSDGTQAIVRDCAVPAGKTLFVPLISTTERSNSGEPNCGAMARQAAGALAHVSRLSMMIDGHPVGGLENHRQPTGECFALDARQASRSATKAAVADGYYVMLQPLPPGPHTIAVEAGIDGTALSTTYHLDVR